MFAFCLVKMYLWMENVLSTCSEVSEQYCSSSKVIGVEITLLDNFPS